MAGRFALLLASTAFEDERLRRLISPAHDVEQLAQVLADEHLGGYAVDTCVDLKSFEVRRRIDRFFRGRDPDDLLLLYVSTHGLKDESGSLYFAAPDTSLDEIHSSTVESSLIHRLSRGCRARRQVFVLDACFSGAFGREWGPKDGQAIHKEDLVGAIDEPPDDGRGLVVFTASTSYQYSFEGGPVEGSPSPSVFTKHLIDGIKTGKADLDGNGVITEDELYRYAYAATQAEKPAQTPQRWLMGASGEVVIARSRAVRPAPLPEEMLAALSNPLHLVRVGAIGALSEIALGSHKGRAVTARQLLEDRASNDDSLAVQSAARQALGKMVERPGSLPGPAVVSLAPALAQPKVAVAGSEPLRQTKPPAEAGQHPPDDGGGALLKDSRTSPIDLNTEGDGTRNRWPLIFVGSLALALLIAWALNMKSRNGAESEPGPGSASQQQLAPSVEPGRAAAPAPAAVPPPTADAANAAAAAVSAAIRAAEVAEDVSRSAAAAAAAASAAAR